MFHSNQDREISAAYGHAVGCLEVIHAALKYDDAYLRSCVERMTKHARERNIQLFKNEHNIGTLVHAGGGSLPHATD